MKLMTQAWLRRSVSSWARKNWSWHIESNFVNKRMHWKHWKAKAQRVREGKKRSSRTFSRVKEREKAQSREIGASFNLLQFSWSHWNSFRGGIFRQHGIMRKSSLNLVNSLISLIWSGWLLGVPFHWFSSLHRFLSLAKTEITWNAARAVTLVKSCENLDRRYHE